MDVFEVLSDLSGWGGLFLLALILMPIAWLLGLGTDGGIMLAFLIWIAIGFIVLAWVTFSMVLDML